MKEIGMLDRGKIKLIPRRKIRVKSTLEETNIIWAWNKLYLTGPLRRQSSNTLWRLLFTYMDISLSKP